MTRSVSLLLERAEAAQTRGLSTKEKLSALSDVLEGLASIIENPSISNRLTIMMRAIRGQW